MNRNRLVLGLLLITAGIVLNQLELENDLADFLMGVSVGVGVGLLITGLIKRKSKK